MSTKPQVLSPEKEPQALVLYEQMTAVQIFSAPGTIDPIIDRIKAEARAEASELDISTEKGRKAIASLAFRVAKAKTRTDILRKQLVAGEKERLKKIDQEGARIWDEFEALQDEVRKPLTDFEEADKARIAKLEQELAEIIGAGMFTQSSWQTLTVEAMKDRLDEIENTATDWQEFAQRAKVAISTTCQQINAAIECKEKAIAEAAELARLRAEQVAREQKEREEKAAQLAAEQARKDAEAKSQREADEAKRQADAEKARIEKAREDAIFKQREAENRAAAVEADRLAVIERAKIAAKKSEDDRIAAAKKSEADKQAAIEAERKRVADEAKREADALAARERDRTHKAKFNREAVSAIVGIGFDESAAKSIIALIAKGGVPHVRIDY